MIERVDQVGRRIHKRAVQIEYNGAGGDHHEPLSVLASSCKWVDGEGDGWSIFQFGGFIFRDALLTQRSSSDNGEAVTQG
jgi:hypothetical protein